MLPALAAPASTVIPGTTGKTAELVLGPRATDAQAIMSNGNIVIKGVRGVPVMTIIAGKTGNIAGRITAVPGAVIIVKTTMFTTVEPVMTEVALEAHVMINPPPKSKRLKNAMMVQAGIMNIGATAINLKEDTG